MSSINTARISATGSESRRALRITRRQSPATAGEIGDLSHAFADIADSLVYLVDAGSRIEDYMGYVEGSYDFDFVNDVDKLLVTVNGAALDKTKLDDNTYGFGRREAAVQAAIVDGNCKKLPFCTQICAR